MQTFAQLILAVSAVWFLWAQNKHNKKIENYMANVNETLAAINTRLDEATTELLDLIAKLQGETLSDEGRAALEAIKTKVDALADVVPNPE